MDQIGTTKSSDENRWTADNVNRAGNNGSHCRRQKPRRDDDDENGRADEREPNRVAAKVADKTASAVRTTTADAAVNTAPMESFCNHLFHVVPCSRGSQSVCNVCCNHQPPASDRHYVTEATPLLNGCVSAAAVRDDSACHAAVCDTGAPDDYGVARPRRTADGRWTRNFPHDRVIILPWTSFVLALGRDSQPILWTHVYALKI